MELVYFFDGFMSALALIVGIVLLFGFIETRKEKKGKVSKGHFYETPKRR